jgi:hypothetical protein
MEELTSDTDLTTSIGVDALVTIGSISDDRMSDMCHMDTDLVGTPCFYTAFEQRECWSIGVLEYLICSF